MEALGTAVSEQLRAMSVLESVAVVAAVLYLLLAIRENIWCWFFAGISTALYVYLMLDAKLYMESLLNAFYFGMALYGWWSWSHAGGGHEERVVTRWQLEIHVIAILVIVLVSAAIGFALDNQTDAAYPYIDSMTTFAAIWTTFLVARKVLENWWYWLVIDAVSVVIYWDRGLELTALLFVVYLIMIPFGLIAWSRSMRKAEPVPA